tara:strand:- start:2467 stop:2703 length:237 start_codon:yes stop_codon:yes gene_type:complete
MSNNLDRLINSSAQDLLGEGSKMYMSLKTAILDHDQKELLKKALFFYQKDACEHYGDVPDNDKGIIESIIDTLHMKHI